MLFVYHEGVVVPYEGVNKHIQIVSCFDSSRVCGDLSAILFGFNEVDYIYSSKDVVVLVCSWKFKWSLVAFVLQAYLDRCSV